MTVETDEMEEMEDFDCPISKELMSRLRLYPEELSREELKVIFENFGEVPVSESYNLIAECFLRIVHLLRPWGT